MAKLGWPSPSGSQIWEAGKASGSSAGDGKHTFRAGAGTGTRMAEEYESVAGIDFFNAVGDKICAFWLEGLGITGTAAVDG